MSESISCSKRSTLKSTGYRKPAWWRSWMGWVVAFSGFTWATAGFYNQSLHLGLPSLIFNKYSEIFVVVCYGIPLIFFIKDRYQKVRMIILVMLLFNFWFLIPAIFSPNVNIFGPWNTGMPSFEVPGTWTNIAMWIAALLFGRRIHCGWMNTCVAIKETAGAPFRKYTMRGGNVFWLSKVKLLTGSFYLFYFALVLIPASLINNHLPSFLSFREIYISWFWKIVCIIYFASLYASPLFGPRVWCRWICPFMLGWANMLGFFRVVVDKKLCNRCGICERQCDFGLPIISMSDKNPHIRTTECMGCGRCRTACPKKAISYYDVRDALGVLWRGLKREKTTLQIPPKESQTIPETVCIFSGQPEP